jgi:Ca2+-binding RTX toxin-like protein
MRTWRSASVTVFGMLALALVSMFAAQAAANNVPASGRLDTSIPLTANNLKPTECAGLNLATFVVGGGAAVSGSSGNDLILGSTGVDTIRGSSPAVNNADGDDCILGGGGGDTIYGDAIFWALWGAGDDVILGGAGNDTIYGDGSLGGSGTDICYGGAGTNPFNNCETANP